MSHPAFANILNHGMTKAQLTQLLGRVPLCGRALRWWANRFSEGSVVQLIKATPQDFCGNGIIATSMAIGLATTSSRFRMPWSEDSAKGIRFLMLARMPDFSPWWGRERSVRKEGVLPSIHRPITMNPALSASWIVQLFCLCDPRSSAIGGEDDCQP